MLVRAPRPRPMWAVHAQLDATILPLHPRYFPFVYASRDEMEQVLMDRIAKDADFARRFEGWLLYCLDVSYAITVKQAPQHVGDKTTLLIGRGEREEKEV